MDHDDDNLKITRTDIISNHNRSNKFKNNNKIANTVENFQKNHKDLIFGKPDKDNIMVAANRNDYNQTSENNLLNNNLYKNVKTDIVPTVENKCNDIVSIWENKRYINEFIAYKLKSHSSVVAKTYPY